MKGNTMSGETSEWLNTMVLIGYEEKRGKAWHWRQGSNNHFTGAVPVDAVRSRLFNWEPVKVTPEYDWTRAVPSMDCATCIGAGKACEAHTETVRRQAEDSAFIIRSDNGDKLGSHSDGFNIHGYDEWLIKNAESIMGQGLEIGQAGLLRNGAQAWVSFEMPDNVEHRAKGSGDRPAVEFRPQLMATTSLDGSVATTYKLVYTIVVCDNTRSLALREDSTTATGQPGKFKIKHTKNSSLKIASARQALDVVFRMTDAFKDELDTLMSKRVSTKQWDAFKELYVPRSEEAGRGQTMADRKRDELNALYESDEMCAPWAGTAYGVIQTVNTWQQHTAIVRKVGRHERNAENAIKGKIDDLDLNTWETLQKALATV